MIGVVLSYDARRGMGQLSAERGGAPVLVYVGEVERAGLISLTPGDRVSFDIKVDKALGRRFAVNLSLLEHSSEHG